MMKTSPLARPLRFTPYAWAKLLRLRDLGETEVGGFGISAKDDLLLVEDVRLVQQVCSPVTVKFKDQSVADYFDEQVDRGLAPERFARLWIHTHPGDSPHPSSTDEQTFARSFGSADWAVMFILAQGGQTYARLRFNAGPRGELLLPVEIDFERPFAASDWEAWDEEYLNSVVPEEIALPEPQRRNRAGDEAKRGASAAELEDRWLERYCHEIGSIAGPFDDEFPPYPYYPEIADGYSAAPF
jgi:proteasome lid subunit RPN8/RPN11